MIKLAVVGATGVVGRKILDVLDRRGVEIDDLTLFSSSRSAGTKLVFKGQPLIVRELTDQAAQESFDYVLMSAGNSVSDHFAPIFEASGAIVIDNSSRFRNEDDMDLVVPGVNQAKLNRHIIANPNCSTIQSVVPLKILDEAYQVTRVAFTTYQAVSGSGKAGLEDLSNGPEGTPPKAYPYPIYNNVLPHIDQFLPDGYTKEEQKMIDETQKILGKDIPTTATCARVPVPHGHSVHINVSLDQPTDVASIQSLFDQDPRVVLRDQPDQEIYPQALEAAGSDDIYVGRIRSDATLPNTFHIWCTADNLLKGAALNTVQILEEVMKSRG